MQAHYENTQEKRHTILCGGLNLDQIHSLYLAIFSNSKIQLPLKLKCLLSAEQDRQFLLFMEWIFDAYSCSWHYTRQILI